MTAGDGALSTVDASDDVGVDGEEALAGLRRQAQHLIAELAGPVRRIRLRSGPAVLEVEWHPRTAPAGRTAGPGPRRHRRPRRRRRRDPGAGDRARRGAGADRRHLLPGRRSPARAPFVAVGDLVRPGQPVGIVEAMKLMNEVTADRAGRVVAVLVEDGEPVEYDQPLVALDPA